MSMLNQIVSKFTGGAESAGSPLISTLLQHEGGMEAIVAKFKQGGMSEIVNSWIGTGENKSISAEQIQSVLGNETVSRLASKVGIDPNMLSSQLTKALPELIDKLSPNGKLQNHEAANA